MKYLLINAIVKETTNKFYGAVYQGLDNNLLGNCVITCVYTLIRFQQVLWHCCWGLNNSPLVIGSQICTCLFGPTTCNKHVKMISHKSYMNMHRYMKCTCISL